MALTPNFDTAEAHKFFAADCFNKAWGFIEKTNRTPEDDEQMIRLAMASLWHWSERPDCKDSNLSIGYWQLSRIYALLRRGEEARHYGTICLRYSVGDEPFLAAYAHEALARAAMIAGHGAVCAQHLAKAEALAEAIADDADRKMLLDDLASIHA